jgi:polyisoprenoid-binding protein YceI
MSPNLRQGAPLLALCAMGLIALASPSTTSVEFDLTRSTMTVAVGKEGIFSFAGDTHTVDAPIASGAFDPAGPAVQLSVDASKMEVQDPPSRRDRVEANMLGPDVLDVARYPKIEFHSNSIETATPTHWKVQGELTLRGQTHPIAFEVTREDGTHFTGSARVKQSDFGITPIRIAGGSVRVKDEVVVTFSIVLASP